MKIWMLKAGELLPIKEGVRKMRTVLLAEKLLEKGHSVMWWTSAFDHFTKDWLFKQDTDIVLSNGLQIKALKGYGYKKNVSLSRLIDHRVLSRKFKKQAAQMERPDIIVTSLPPYDMAYEAVKYAKKMGVPIIVDIRDRWPDIFLDHVPDRLSGFARLALHREFSMARKTMSMADGLVSMMNKLLDWGLRGAGRQKTWRDQVFYLGYKKPELMDRKNQKTQELIDSLKGKFVVTYAGTFSSYNDPSILLDCAKRSSDEDIQFVLAGDGDYSQKIEEEAASLKNVKLTGWLDDDSMANLLSNSHIGVCPTTQDAEAFNNKLFAYLSYGLPIISAFYGEQKEFIERSNIGFYYKPNDVSSLSKYIAILKDGPTLYDQMSQNASRVFNDMFRSDKVYSEYAEHIEKIKQDHSKNKEC